MTIDIQLFSEESILAAIRRLRNVEQNLRWGVQDTIDALVTDGAMVATAQYKGMANAVGYMPDEARGIIASTGEANLIAEFGAGDATLPPLGMFENAPETPVYPGAYSELVGTREYATTGKWHFGGQEFHEVEPRFGLYNAKNYIEKNAVYIAKEVIKL